MPINSIFRCYNPLRGFEDAEIEHLSEIAIKLNLTNTEHQIVKNDQEIKWALEILNGPLKDHLSAIPVNSIDTQNDQALPNYIQSLTEFRKQKIEDIGRIDCSHKIAGSLVAALGLFGSFMVSLNLFRNTDNSTTSALLISITIILIIAAIAFDLISRIQNHEINKLKNIFSFFNGNIESIQASLTPDHKTLITTHRITIEHLKGLEKAMQRIEREDNRIELREIAPSLV
jgi:hypothetical protein